MIGYFEGIDSERGIAWRTADSLALRGFLGLDAGALRGSRDNTVPQRIETEEKVQRPQL